MKNKNLFIFGLGNPGSQYQHTRHNAGFLLLNYLTLRLGMPPFSLKKKLEVHLSRRPSLILAKPTTFMNHSGRAVRKTLEYFCQDFELGANQELNQLYIAHDDLDLEIGTYKIQYGTGPSQHNGLNSVYQHIKIRRFWHIRIGVDDRQGDRSIPAESYVLQAIPQTQQDKLSGVFDQVMQQLPFETDGSFVR